MLDKAGKAFKREAGLEIRRAPVDGDERAGLYEITFWQQFRDVGRLNDLFSTSGFRNPASGLHALPGFLAVLVAAICDNIPQSPTPYYLGAGNFTYGKGRFVTQCSVRRAESNDAIRRDPNDGRDQEADAAPVELSAAQKQTIYQSISQTQKNNAEPTGFRAAVGAAVPEAIELAPVPATIANLMPQTKGLESTMVEGRVVLVEPKSKQIDRK